MGPSRATASSPTGQRTARAARWSARAGAAHDSTLALAAVSRRAACSQLLIVRAPCRRRPGTVYDEDATLMVRALGGERCS